MGDKSSKFMKLRGSAFYQAGFSLMELSVVIVVLGILTFVLLPRGVDDTSVGLRAQAEQLIADIRLTQSYSMQRFESYRLDFSSSTGYRILDRGGNPAPSTGIHGSVVTLPAGMTISLDSSDKYLGFNSSGEPENVATPNGTGTTLINTAHLTLSYEGNSVVVAVTAETGWTRLL